MSRRELANTILKESDPLMLAAVETLLLQRPVLKPYDLATIYYDMDEIEAEAAIKGYLTLEQSKEQLFGKR